MKHLLPIIQWLCSRQTLLGAKPRRRVFTYALALFMTGGVMPESACAQVGRATCTGNFINFVSDVCWDCMFPIAIGQIAAPMGQEDNDSNPPSPICICPTARAPYVRVGLALGYWEPAYVTEFVRTPFCFPTLGGMMMSSSTSGTWGARDARSTAKRIGRTSFYQAHNYTTPLLYLMGLVTTEYCVLTSGYDLAYMTEYDPSWDSDETAMLLAPESVLFTNLVTIAACTVDCVAASIGFGIRELFWCAGCNGHIYPFNGKGQVHQGGVQATALLTQRFFAKMHRMTVSWQTWGQSAQCAPHPAPLMDKTGYKTQIVYPVAMTSGTDGTGARRCCQPLGRTTQIYGALREFPILGEDFAFMVWRKRNCCASD